MRQSRFIIDGEICVLDVRGVSDFNALHSNQHNEEAQLYAFDLVAIDGDDLRDMPLHERKAQLGKLLKGRPEGIFVAPFETGEIGPGLFEAACRMGLEGLVSKHRERRYRPRTCDWIKVKNRKHPAFNRVMDQLG
jgi:bifunctional non-homologous end joining protein LigD